jgi:hypothetical protein
VRIVVELMEVIRDLCGCSAAFTILGEHARAAVLIEQCAELLAHRARLLARLRGDGVLTPQMLPGGPSRPGGLEWTN